MLRAPALAITAVAAALALAACTAPAPEPTPSTTSDPTVSAPGGALPTCAAIGDAIAPIASGLALDEALSESQTAPEAYDQRVCVFVAEDGVTQVGVTIAAIPFLQDELDGYSALPGAIDDDRLGDSGAVLQTLDPDDRADGHLDSALYLFDTVHSITVQGYSTAGELAVVLPDLTIDGAATAAFAVRDLL